MSTLKLNKALTRKPGALVNKFLLVAGLCFFTQRTNKTLRNSFTRPTTRDETNFSWVGVVLSKAWIQLGGQEDKALASIHEQDLPVKNNTNFFHMALVLKRADISP